MNITPKLEMEIVKLMRGNYKLDEIAGKFYGTPCVKFRQGKKTIVSINLHEDHYVFQIILGKVEREKFERMRDEFPIEIQELFDRTPTYHDGKWLLIRVDNLEEFESVKKLILLKKKPNRKPFSKENAFYGKCGHRCDLCVHYMGLDEESREKLIPHLNTVYGNTDWSMRCSGCDTSECQCYTVYDICEPLKCLKDKQINSCFCCEQYPCKESTVGYKHLEHRNLSTDDVTWGILPYVPYQYEK